MEKIRLLVEQLWEVLLHCTFQLQSLRVGYTIPHFGSSPVHVIQWVEVMVLHMLCKQTQHHDSIWINPQKQWQPLLSMGLAVLWVDREQQWAQVNTLFPLETSDKRKTKAGVSSETSAKREKNSISISFQLWQRLHSWGIQQRSLQNSNPAEGREAHANVQPWYNHPRDILFLKRKHGSW